MPTRSAPAAVIAHPLRRLRDALPQGHTLPEAVWLRRHRALLLLLVAHAVGLTVLGVLQGYGVVHSVGEGLVPAAFAGLAMLADGRKRVAAALVSLGLITSSAILVHICGGVIEAHFHFFVMIILLSLYEEWFAFLLAMAYVVVHHGLTGALDPASVYNHPDAVAHPWRWAAIHGLFVTGASIGAVAAWRTNEAVRGETRRAYQQARASEERFRSAFEDAPVGMALFDVHGPEEPWRLSQVNGALCRFLGHPVEEILGRPLCDLTHPDDVPACVASINALLSDEVPTSVLETRHIRSDGEVVSGILHCSILRDQAGTPIHGIAQLHDTTERRRAEDALRESRERLQAVLDNAKAAIYVKDLAGRYLMANADAAAMAGRRPEEMVGKTDYELYPDDVAARFVAGDRAVLDSGEPVRFEKTVPLASGTATYIAQKFLLRDADGEIYAVGGISTDITERVRVEQDKSRLEQALHQAQRLDMLGRLAGGIAHDFNNLTVVVLNTAALLESDLADVPEALEGLAEIRKAAERTAGLTQQLVTFSRGQILEPELVQLNELVGEEKTLLRRALGVDLELTTDLASDLWPVVADRGQLERVVLNLVVNARDAMRDGGCLSIATSNVVIDAAQAERLPEALAPGRYVRLSVSDTGCGMGEEVSGRAFEPFFTTKGPSGGTGLGLATVYGVVMQAGGRVELESSPGAGTTVSLYLPATESREGRPEAQPTDEPDGETILVVDDEDAVRALIARILSRGGYRVVEAPGPEEAIQEFERRSAPIDLLLTDVVMPKMSGGELAGTMSSLQPGLRVAFMSGYTDDVVIRHGSGDQKPLLLKKPFTPEGLLSFVATGLSSPDEATSSGRADPAGPAAAGSAPSPEKGVGLLPRANMLPPAAGAEHNLQPDEPPRGSLPPSLPLQDDPRESAEPTWAAVDPLLRIRSANQAGHWTLELEGELDVSNAAVLAKEIHRVEPHADDLTIDLRELAFIDSSGVLAILDAHHRRLRDGRDGRLHLRKGTGELQPIFRLSGLEEMLPFDG